MAIFGSIKRKSTGRARCALAAGAAVLALATSQAAQAYEAYVNGPAPILTGPSTDYPPVVYLHGGEEVEVYGCLDDYDWCDVSFREFRGWFDASQLSYPYQGQQVPLYDYGYDIGLPIIGFSFNDYWGRYYRDRPFFRERERWAAIPLPPRVDRRHFDGRPGFEPGRGPGFDRPDHDHDHDHDHDRPDFDHDHGGPGRPDFNRGPYPAGQGGPAPGHPDFQQRGPGPQPQQQPAPGFQRGPQAQLPPQPQAEHMQGPQSRQRFVGPGVPPQGGPRPGPAPAAAPHPQAGPAPQARPAGGGGHPEGGHPDNHHQDNK